ncbi:hypothetical protein FJ941_10815 [Mesorhizobium sp. B2-3-13]|uniref:hypothetical protein n=1 Tax=Mesorhizobium sp. B2-3-13 TaxID=2589951 RepID=UPI001125F50B|nr:hypothetical protein [Mesorhizobium sp. B2-3-13]TPL83754.1 hypothetical protein FJ941_10815 [Mesorhizobium sp. B2-3-13]
MRSSADPNHDPAQTFFVLLRMVTPIDHFPLILNRADQKTAAAVALRQQIEDRIAIKTVDDDQKISVDFRHLGATAAAVADLPLGKLRTRLCDSKAVWGGGFSYWAWPEFPKYAALNV